jgi:adenosylhomocysteine nucleosidase
VATLLKESGAGGLCLVFALAREARAVRRLLGSGRSLSGAPCPARRFERAGQPVFVLETGVGERRVETALNWLLGAGGEAVASRLRVVLSAGYSGALQDAYAVGDLILATEVADLHGNRWGATWPGGLPVRGGPVLHRGRLLCVPGMLGGAEDKRELGQRHQAVAVDMETAAVARLCTEHSIPFGCVRVISDAVHTRLSPRLVSLLSGGRVAPLRLLAALATAPSLAGELWRLARDTRRANRRLVDALEWLLPSWTGL